MLKWIKYLFKPPIFKCLIKNGKVTVVKGKLNQKQITAFNDIAMDHNLSDVSIYGAGPSNKGRLEFSGKISDGIKQQYRNVWLYER